MKELTRTAWESTKTPEFQNTFKAQTADRNKEITHEEFVEGLQNGTMAFTCSFGEPFQFLSIPQKKVFSIFVILHKFAPIVLVPIWAFYEHNWWILLGIVASQLGLFLAARATVEGAKSASGGFLPFLFVGLWIWTGFHSTETICSLCALWSWALFLIADQYQSLFAERNLINNPELFYDAATSGKIMIVRRGEESVA
ncbi:MAG: hypothetical protein NTY53_08390 [Kiritimatiellaeota bacterium]|nr:hypothetical protein [Kiritimatiellota bacterium]